MDALLMVLTELSENAVKYGEYQAGDGFTINLEIEVKYIAIEVISPVGNKARGDVGRLLETIQWIADHTNPMAAYTDKIRELSSRGESPGESGLGLVRIAYEGQSRLEGNLEKNGRLRVRAVYDRV